LSPVALNEVIAKTEKHLEQFAASEQAEADEFCAHTRLGSFLHHALQAYLEALGNFTLADVLNPQADTAGLFEFSEEAA
jgi:DNA-binding IscR family transcriptional regulator